MDIKFDGNTVVFQNGQLYLTADMAESLSQRLTIKLKTLLASWFLNEDYGIDYFKRVFEKTIPKISIDTMFQSKITEEPLVDKILNFRSVIERNSYQLNFRVKLRSGEVTPEITILVDEAGRAVLTQDGFAIRIN